MTKMYVTTEVRSKAQSESLRMKIRNAKKACLSPTAFMIYLEGLASLSNAEALAESGFKVKEPTVFIPPKPKAKKEVKKPELTEEY